MWGDWGPYYPEPFGNYVYASRCISSPPKLSDKITETGLTQLFKGAVGFKPNPIVDICSVDAYKSAQEEYLITFALITSLVDNLDRNNTIAYMNRLTLQENKIPEKLFWQEISKNGFNYIDGVCNDYLRQLYRLKKNTKGLKSLTGNIGNAASGIVSATALAGGVNVTQTLAIMAAAFGLGATVFDTYESSILLEAEYSSIYRMVKILQSSVKVSNFDKISNRSDTVKAIQSYLAVCTPQAIEASINTKIGSVTAEETLISLGIVDIPAKDIVGALTAAEKATMAESEAANQKSKEATERLEAEAKKIFCTAHPKNAKCAPKEPVVMPIATPATTPEVVLSPVN